MLRLTAPFDGTVIESQAVPGLRVDASAPLFRIARPGALGLEVQLPVGAASMLDVGASVMVEPDGPSGTIEQLGQRLSADSQTLPVRARLTTPGRLRIGQFVTVRIQARVAAGWQLPTAALVEFEGASWVFVRTPQGFAPRRVQRLFDDDGGTAIDAALAASDRVAVSGVAELKALALGRERR